MNESTFFVMVVDNDQQVVDIFQQVGQTEFLELSVVGASSAQIALDYLADSTSPRPHLILLDIDLHGPVSGFDLIPQLQLYSKRLIPIIIFTTSDIEENVALAYNRGAVAYTRKPVELSGWKDYIRLLRNYWFRTTSLPNRME